jgi:hypothetical protein
LLIAVGDDEWRRGNDERLKSTVPTPTPLHARWPTVVTTRLSAARSIRCAVRLRGPPREPPQCPSVVLLGLLRGHETQEPKRSVDVDRPAEVLGDFRGKDDREA